MLENREKQTKKRQGTRQKPAYRGALYGMLIALAFIFSYIEAMLPVPMPVPGMKLGLSNLVTIVSLYTVGFWGTVFITLLRILLVAFTFSNLSAMLFSMAGGILSLLAMGAAKRSGWYGQVNVSIVGGVSHNAGQLAMAALVNENLDIFYYLPFLTVSGVLAGAVIGILGGLVLKRLDGYLKKTGI